MKVSFFPPVPGAGREGVKEGPAAGGGKLSVTRARSGPPRACARAALSAAADSPLAASSVHKGLLCSFGSVLNI